MIFRGYSIKIGKKIKIISKVLRITESRLIYIHEMKKIGL